MPKFGLKVPRPLTDVCGVGERLHRFTANKLRGISIRGIGHGLIIARSAL
jgi:hypothetical protein